MLQVTNPPFWTTFSTRMFSQYTLGGCVVRTSRGDLEIARLKLITPTLPVILKLLRAPRSKERADLGEEVFSLLLAMTHSFKIG